MFKFKKIFLILCIALTIFVMTGCKEEGNDPGGNTGIVTNYSINFESNEISIRAGQEEELSYSTNLPVELEWESDNDKVAVVEEGIVTAIDAGVANITAKGTVNGESFTASVKVTVTKKGPSTFNVTIGDKTYSIAAGKPVSALIMSLYDGIYEKKEGYAFEGWYIDPAFTVSFDIYQTLDKDVTIFPKYRETSDKVGTPLEINKTLKYNSGLATDLGNVFTISPAYTGKMDTAQLSNYTVVSARYDIQSAKYKVVGYQSGNYEVPYDGMLIGIKNSWEKCDETLLKLMTGATFDLNTYSVNTATKIYFDRQMDSGNVYEVTPATLSCSFCSAYDVTYDKYLYTKNGDGKAYPASTTKIITAITALKYAKPTDTYTIGSELDVMYQGSSPSTAGLVKGQVWTLHQLLYATLLPSGNDAAYAVAALCMDVKEPGNKYGAREKIDKFAELMNETAREVGATNSHFMVPDGNSYYKSNGAWDDRITYHYVTANDMVKICKYALTMGEFAEVVSTPSVTFTLANGKQYSFNNTNNLIKPSTSYYLSGTIGIKTGTTNPAGNCLITAVEYNGRVIIVAVLKASTSANRNIDSLKVYRAIFPERTDASLVNYGK